MNSMLLKNVNKGFSQGIMSETHTYKHSLCNLLPCTAMMNLAAGEEVKTFMK